VLQVYFDRSWRSVDNEAKQRIKERIKVPPGGRG
jgi:hypothetical protein